MIILRTALPIVEREDIWASEINIKELSPARRDKLISLIDLTGFTLRTDAIDMKAGEIRNIDSILKIENGV